MKLNESWALLWKYELSLYEKLKQVKYIYIDTLLDNFLCNHEIWLFDFKAAGFITENVSKDGLVGKVFPFVPKLSNNQIWCLKKAERNEKYNPIIISRVTNYNVLYIVVYRFIVWIHYNRCTWIC